MLVALLLSGCAGSSARRAQPKYQSAPPLLTAQLMPWQLGAPISRAVVLAENGAVVIAGGLTRNGSSATGVFRLNPGTGSLDVLGALAQPVHDAAGAYQNGRTLLFGGGSTSTVATVQEFTRRSGGTEIGRLPRPRSDLTSIAVGRYVYLLGGYDGARLASDVLRTADGIHFHSVTRLRVPVRYPAAAALGSRLFIFGGQNAGDASITAIQEVNLKSDKVRVVGHLPIPVAHGSAVVLRGHLYVAGGRSGGTAQRRIWSFDPAQHRIRPAGFLPIALSDMGSATIGQTAYLIGGENWTQQASVVKLQAQSSGSTGALLYNFPFRGRLLIADRGNNRLLLVTRRKRVLWRYPSTPGHAPRGGFYFPDDSFFVDRGKRIVVNQEGNETIVEVGFPSGRVLWSFGHAGIPGTRSGYLHEPDDAYLLRDGDVVVADAQNCRVLFISPAHKILHQIGTTGLCVHKPPVALGSPNGDTPLRDGNILISEINGSWISEYTPTGQLVWTVQLPIAYPSDPQQIASDRYLVADYAKPGGLYEFSRSGRILWTYRVTQGKGMLDHPSLVERLPNGLLMVTDDYRDRLVVINPVTKTIVWQYGRTDIPGARPGYLNTPDGFDVLTASGTTPTHPYTR